MNKLIYLVDDEIDICQFIHDELKKYGYTVKYFHKCADAMEAVNEQQPDVCIIDLGLPDIDGIELVRHLINKSNTGIIILSGRCSLTDKIVGLEQGADDYITKPFEPRELIARISSVIRRTQKASENIKNQKLSKRAHFDNWIFDIGTLTLSHTSGYTDKLSVAEGNLLFSLLKSPQEILNRDQLLENTRHSFDRSIDVRISRIRKKIEIDADCQILIKTVYGAGYIFTAKVEWY